MYIHLNKKVSSGLEGLEHLLPKKRPGKRGVEPGMSSVECMRRYLEDEFETNGKKYKSSWIWPREPTDEETHLLMAAMLEIAVYFFFENFVYTFGGENMLQSSGGPIGARITMCIAKLVMQCWWEDFLKILKDSNIEELLRAIYVDDGRMVVEKLKLGQRFDAEQMMFVFNENLVEDDIQSGLTEEQRTEREMKKAMNSISEDLAFTTETEFDFDNRRLPTLSFQLWSDK